ncbi:exonuclease 3'-5' domain-containing protein 2 isoform X2 [Chrysoperla carnea]|uniref:exonuclease 3'-5' domain-containing protein 2 isoform X2 n=1 Tax=Chrysoperla carnea TaxID=189513 RepID=UPI001D090D2B|nr:exonuclease 3'-5' domain-containing protein 2 isoform X2 [Chrysoperla carnea]
MFVNNNDITNLIARIQYKSAVGFSVALGISLYGVYLYLKRKNNIIVNLLNNAQIVVVNKETSNLDQLAEILLSHIREQPILGFDCEWITEGKKRRPIALLQLATYKQFCVILRLTQLPDIPKTFKQILANENVLKVGVCPTQDANYLYHDYGIETNGCLDLRHLTNESLGLANLSKKYLNFVMNKHWRIRCSNWEADILNEAQITYAAHDAIIAVELFKKMRQLSKQYIHKNLAHLVKENPFTIKLNFEPEGRAVGESGEYYKVAKLNRCVVCGCPDSYIRKNVVPREYRKLFPIIMKEHSSHDVLLLCVKCHQKSNLSDIVLRNKLAKLCDAPIGAGNVKMYDSPAARELKSAAKALLRASDKLPQARREELEKIIFKYFPGKVEITKSMLETAECVATSIKNDKYEPHGKKVVDYFISHCNPNYQNELGTGGLTELEQLWRQHFLEVMTPKYLPEHWSVTHNKNRLEIRAGEGRINLEDLKIAGCDENLLISKT